MLKTSVLIFCVVSLWIQTSETKSSRIIGGVGANAGQFPFMAAIYITKPGGSYFCSGTLIDNWFILTAGQCVDGATLFTIDLGSNYLSGNDSNRLRVATDNYFLHPGYNPNTLENDVGLIKLRERITRTDYIDYVRYLATATLQDSATVVTMGWGQTSDETAGPVDKLNYVYLVTVSKSECMLSFGSQITDEMVCVAGVFNQGTCLGDSGSPLLQYISNGAAYHVGISSFYSGNGCESADPSGFTRTSFYVDWINNITASN